MTDRYDYLYPEENNINNNNDDEEFIDDWETFKNKDKNQNVNATAPPPDEKRISTNQVQIQNQKYDIDKLIETKQLNYDILIENDQNLQDLGQHLNIRQLKVLCLYLDSAIQIGLNKNYINNSDGVIDLKSITTAYKTGYVDTAFKLGYCLADLISEGYNINNFIEEYGNINSFIMQINNIKKNNEDFFFSLVSLDNLNNINSEDLDQNTIDDIKEKLNDTQIKFLKWKCDFWNIID